MVATVAVCSYIKYQKTEVEIARFDYRMRVMKEESYRMQNGRGLFADESGDSENNTGYQESIGIWDFTVGSGWREYGVIRIGV